MSHPPSHEDQLSKLNRAIGQLEAVRRMINEGRYCVDILTQLRAARSAVKTVELGVLETHMHACLRASRDDDAQQDVKLSEIMSLLKKYE